MAFDAALALTRLLAILATVTALQQVVTGIPTSFQARVSAAVAFVGGPIRDVYAGGALDRATRFLVIFGYRVNDAEATAELVLAAAVDDFTIKFHEVAAHADFNGGYRRADLDTSLAMRPEYSMVSGQEFRQFPMLVTVWQRQNYNPVP